MGIPQSPDSRAKPRPHANVGVPRLAGRKLAGDGIRELRVSRAHTQGAPEHVCTVEVYSPRLSDGREPQHPSPLLAHPPRLETLESPAPPKQVLFEWDESTVRAQVLLPPGSSCYGTGAVPGPLLRTGRSVKLWNTDAWCYGEENPALYQSHPYVLALLPDGSCVGLLADSFRRGRIEIAVDGVELQFEAEPFDLYRIEGPDPLEVQKALAALIGRMPMPPLWALGYHQCRWSYASAREVLEIAAEMRRRRIPCDAIWIDIDYMDHFRVFSWNQESFPDPRALIDRLHEQDFHVVAILDPGIACDPGDAVYQSGLAGDHFVRSAEGRVVKGRVWPGICHFPDFTSRRTRRWWAAQVERFLEQAPLDGLWNDMNEPALFRCPTATLPEDARHAGDENTGEGTHARFHNLYGQLMAEATRAGIERRFPDRPPFVLTRSNHISGSRFAATWTGDNQSRWEDLRWSISMVLNLGLCGQPFSGPDAGGFYGDPTPELFARWFELAALLPFFRGHGEKSSCRKEPWSFAEVEPQVRLAIERRMRLLPTLFTLFHEAAQSGAPIVRPLFFVDPSNPRLRAVDDCFLLGDALLVAPVLEPGVEQRELYLPEHSRGGWHSLAEGGEPGTGERLVPAPLGSIPLFAKAGSILIEASEAQTTRLGPMETWSVRVFLDQEGRAEGRLYWREEDRGEEEARLRRYEVTVEGRRLSWREDGEDSAPPARDVLVFDSKGGRFEARARSDQIGVFELRTR